MKEDSSGLYEFLDISGSDYCSVLTVIKDGKWSHISLSLHSDGYVSINTTHQKFIGIIFEKEFFKKYVNSIKENDHYTSDFLVNPIFETANCVFIKLSQKDSEDHKQIFACPRFRFRLNDRYENKLNLYKKFAENCEFVFAKHF
jgi:hypothetical protein